MTKDETQIPASNQKHNDKQKKEKGKDKKENNNDRKKVSKKGGLRSRSRSAPKMSPKNNG